ncbi:MAG: OmpA family protein [Flavobacteriaceae bacterium]|nr:OmpA family protein [Flavobacteriaceae bacterium]
MKPIYYTVLIAILLLFMGPMNAQSGSLKKADRKFEDLAYIDAVSIYETIAEKGYEDSDLFERLGDGHYFNAKYAEAAKWYEKLKDYNGGLSAEYSFRYGQSLKATGRYDEADAYMADFFRSQGVEYLGSESYLRSIDAHSNRFKVNPVAFNTRYSDYPAFLQKDSLYVISAGDGKVTPWNKEPTSNINYLSGTSLTEVSGALNTEFNEGSLTITKDGSTMYFTRNDYDGKKRGKDSNKITRLKLYRAFKIGGEWGQVEELPFNDSEYSFGHPMLNEDDSKLYFVSDMPNNGSKGGTDIYEVEIFADGGFGAPFNMAGFNTAGNEMFPYVAEDGTFYFASNGHQENLGGLDIYESKLTPAGVYGKVQNLGKPVNGPTDDFAYVYNSTDKKGYFASNRGGNRSDDIYYAIENEGYQPECIVMMTGVIRDKNTLEILENTLVSLIDAENKVISQKVVAAGQYEFDEMDCNRAKFVRAEKNGYQTQEEMLGEPTNGVVTTDVLLSKRSIDLSTGTDLGLIVNPIYFDLGKHNIRPDAEIELQKIATIMKDNPSIKVDVRSHTDSRSNDYYNMSLSNRRAQSTINYLVRAGIDRSRLTGRGFGETQLQNGCANGVRCSETEHQRNRRSEFIVIN